MEPTTLFYLGFFGPIFVIMGASILLYRKQYMPMIKELRPFTLPYYLAAFLALALGLFMVLTHNLWTTTPEIVVSVIAWGTLLKGAIRFLAPQLTQPMVKWVAKSGAMTVMSAIILIVGVYMSWTAYVG